MVIVKQAEGHEKDNQNIFSISYINHSYQGEHL